MELLKYTGREDVNKIPLVRILKMKCNMNKNHNFKVDVSKPLEEQNVFWKIIFPLIMLFYHKINTSNANKNSKKNFIEKVFLLLYNSHKSYQKLKEINLWV